MSFPARGADSNVVNFRTVADPDGGAEQVEVVLPARAGDVATTLTDGRKTSTTPGTAVALRSSLACRWVIVTALPTNTGLVWVGGSGVLGTLGSQTGSPLSAGQSATFPVDNASKMFIDVLVSGEGATFTVGA